MEELFRVESARVADEFPSSFLSNSIAVSLFLDHPTFASSPRHNGSICMGWSCLYEYGP